MLLNGDALDHVLGRGTPDFGPRVKGKLLVNMATNSAAYAKGLEVALLAEGGRYVEAPVSGSRVPAELGKLLAMVAGSPEDVKQVLPLLTPLCRQAIPCGLVPGGTLMKFATLIVNVATITAIAEAMQFARRYGLDLERFNEALLQGPLASDVARVKAPKLTRKDFTPQAAIRNAIESHRLVVEAAWEAGIPTPVEDACLGMYGRAMTQGLGDEDMVAVIKVYEAMNRTDR
jgi:3-hydroxyisobutyrate dehydrogenase